MTKESIINIKNIYYLDLANNLFVRNIKLIWIFKIILTIEILFILQKGIQFFILFIIIYYFIFYWINMWIVKIFFLKKTFQQYNTIQLGLIIL